MRPALFLVVSGVQWTAALAVAAHPRLHRVSSSSPRQSSLSMEEPALFTLPPDAPLERCLEYAPSICDHLKAGEYTDPELHLGPMAAFLGGESAPNVISSMTSAGARVALAPS